MFNEVLAAVLIILLVIAINGYATKNHQLPGPFPLPLIGGAYVLFGHLSGNRLINRVLDLSKKYNGTFSILFGNKTNIVISKPEHIQVFSTSPHFLDHASEYDILKTIIPKGLFTANGALWKSMRNAWVPSFHPAVIRTFVKTFQDLSDIFVEKLKKEVNGPEFPLSPYLIDYSMDAVFATNLEFDHNSQREFRYLNKIVVPMTEILQIKSFNVFYHIETVFNWSTAGRKMKQILNYFYEYLGDVVKVKTGDILNEENLADNDLRKKLFLRQLLGARNASKEVLHDEIMTLILTGADTSIQAMGFIALMLGKHQDVQERVFLEDQEIQKSLNGRELEMDDLKNYVYLDRVIKETLRIFSIVPLIGRKAAQDVKIGDIMVPKGSSVVCFTLALHRDPEIYPNPLVFNPDNFLPEKVAARHPYSYVPFSRGPRNCIGKKFAMTSLMVLTSSIVRNYRLFSNKNVEDIPMKSKLLLCDVDDFLVRIEKR